MNWYSFLVGLGSSLAIWRVVQERDRQDKLPWAIAALWVLFGAWMGARIAFFVWYPAAIIDFGWLAFGLQEGGMVWPGAIIGAWITILVLALVKKTSVLIIADRLLVMIPPMAILSWLAGWFSGSAYGVIVPQAWWAPITMDDTFQFLPRFPLQWLAATSLFLIFLLVESRIPKNKPGSQAAIIWFIFSVHTLLFSFLRADLRLEWLGLPWDIWFVFFCLFWAFVLCWIVFIRKTKTQT